MMTKWRLLLDFLLQLSVLLVVTLLLAFYPENGWLYWISALALLSGWQLLHAWYVVHKHSDWQRNQYLQHFKQIIAYSLLTLGVGGCMVLLSFGMLAPFGLFIWNIVSWAGLLGLSLLVLYAFFTSIRRLYQYYYRPRSFWDL